MLDRSFDDHLGFGSELGKFNKIIDGVVAAEVLKSQIRETVRTMRTPSTPGSRPTARSRAASPASNPTPSF